MRGVITSHTRQGYGAVSATKQLGPDRRRGDGRGLVHRLSGLRLSAGGAVLLLGLALSASAAPLPLDDPAGAVAFLLAPDAPPAAPKESGGWDGSLALGIVRTLFWGYHVFLSSQDSATCSFEPSCSRFAQQAIAEHGFFEGALDGIDRLIRDSPLAIPFYPMDLDTGLLRDAPTHYCLGCEHG